MGLDFPVTIKLREGEHRAALELVKREPLLSKAEVVTGTFLMGAMVARSDAGFQRLLGILRKRKQGAEFPDWNDAA